VAGFLIAVFVFHDILAVAIAFVLRGYLLLPLNLYWMRVYGGIPIREHLFELRGVAAATAVMAAALVAVKLVLGHIHPGLLLVVEVGVGLVVFGLALLILERGLVAEIVAVGAQAVPGLGRIARLLHLPMAAVSDRKVRQALDTSVEAEIAAGAQLDPTGIADEELD
jgi:hypothetical protein